MMIVGLSLLLFANMQPVKGLKCNQCREKGEACKDKKNWQEPQMCSELREGEDEKEREICQYTVDTNTTSGAVLKITMGCEEKKNCDKGCRVRDGEKECYTCCTTDLCNTEDIVNSGIVAVHSVAAIVLSGIF